MDKNIVDWRWIPRYYKKVDDKTSHVDVVYWYFVLETFFIVVMAFVFYFTTIKDGFLKKSQMDNQVESLRKSIEYQIQQPAK